MTTPSSQLFGKIKSAKKIKDITNALNEYYRLNDIGCQKYITSNNIILACCSGCNFCCNIKVEARPYEIFIISGYIEDNFSPIQKDQIINSLKKHKTHLSELTEINHFSRNVPCPLLVDGGCSGYPVRPLACRAYTSLDVSSCKHTFENPSDLYTTRPKDSDLEIQWEYIKENVASNFQKAGYDISYHELGTALLESISDPINQKRWRSRKKAFLNLHTYLND